MSYVPADHAPPMWDHQARELEASAHLRERALWWEQRTGKSRVVVDTAAFQYEAGAIDAVVVVAYPSAVHHNWATNEFPAYLPRRIKRKIVAWDSKRARSRGYQEELSDLLTFRGLAVLTANCEALARAELFWKYLRKFLHKRRVLAVADEANWLSTPSASQTKKAETLARHAVTRRVLTGTPVDESPFAAFGMTNFLHRGVLGFQHAATFRARYGEYAPLKRGDGSAVTRFNQESKWNPNAPVEVPVTQLVGYRNLDELKEKLLTIGSRVLRSECADLPEKIYRSVPFDLTPTQRRAYDELRDEYRTRSIEAANPLARITYLSMIARGYLPEAETGAVCSACAGLGCDQCDGLGFLKLREPRQLVAEPENPAIEALVREAEALTGPFVVWCRFLWDVRDVVTALEERLNLRVARYDGSVSSADRAAVSSAFQRGELDAIVATRAGSRGIRLDRAVALVYYSQGSSLIDRSQSEDRAESLTRERGTLVLDLVANDTVDERVVDALRTKRSIAELVMGDPTREWI